MTDNTPNQQPEKPAANTAQPIENKPTEPQKQPEKPTPTTQKQPEKTASQQPDSAPQQPIVIQQKASGGRGIATGALVLSLIALGASGFLFVQGQNVLKQQEMRIGQDLNKAALGNSENAALLQSTLAKQAELDAQLSKILQNESDTAQTLDGIHRAYAELLKGRVNWLVDAIEVTLNTASQPRFGRAQKPPLSQRFRHRPAPRPLGKRGGQPAAAGGQHHERPKRRARAHIQSRQLLDTRMGQHQRAGEKHGRSAQAG